MKDLTVVLLFFVVPCWSQRPFYAGLRPISYPDIQRPSDSSGSSGDLPARLNGDVAYANKLSKLPENQQPFWFLNRQHYAELLKHPSYKSFTHRPSYYNDPIPKPGTQ